MAFPDARRRARVVPSSALGGVDTTNAATDIPSDTVMPSNTDTSVLSQPLDAPRLECSCAPATQLSIGSKVEANKGRVQQPSNVEEQQIQIVTFDIGTNDFDPLLLFRKESEISPREVRVQLKPIEIGPGRPSTETAAFGTNHQLEVFAQPPSNGLAEIRELARSAREDARTAVGAVKDIESRFSAFESHEPRRTTDDQLVSLTALVQRVACEVKALEFQRTTLEGLVVLVTQAGRKVPALEDQSLRYNERSMGQRWKNFPARAQALLNGLTAAAAHPCDVATRSVNRTWIAVWLASHVWKPCEGSGSARRWLTAALTMLRSQRALKWLRCRAVAIGHRQVLVLVSVVLTSLINDGVRWPHSVVGGFSVLKARPLSGPFATLISTGTSMSPIEVSVTRGPADEAPDRTRRSRVAFIGTVAINSKPPVATVFIDRQPVGATPFRAAVTAGSHVIWLQREGFQRWTTGVLVAADKLTPIDVTLRPEAGR
jgi:PEGA domain-containing protein